MLVAHSGDARYRQCQPVTHYVVRDAGLLRLLRQQCELSQYQVAAKVGVTRGAVAHWERGRAGQKSGLSAEDATALASMYGVWIETLFEPRRASPTKQPPPSAQDAGQHPGAFNNTD